MLLMIPAWRHGDVVLSIVTAWSYGDLWFCYFLGSNEKGISEKGSNLVDDSCERK